MKAFQIERPPNGALTHRLKSQKWNKMAVFLSCLVFGVITQALLQSAKAQIKYTVTRLVPLSGVSSSPGALNAQGDVVGAYNWRSGTSHVFLNHAGVMHDIAALAGSIPTGINIYGRIVGNSLPNVGPYTYFEKKAWSLSSISGFTSVAVNTASHIVCTSYFSGGFIWQKSGRTSLPGLVGNEFFPSAINNSDQVAGSSHILQGPLHAALLSGGQAIDLGTLQTKPTLFPIQSYANAVNDQGQVAGASELQQGGGQITTHAFIYSGGKMQDIQTLSIAFASIASGINNSGQVVGLFSNDTGYTAFVYDGSQMIDLNTLIDPAAGWFLIHATAINDAGQILAIGNFQNEGYLEACLLTPVR